MTTSPSEITMGGTVHEGRLSLDDREAFAAALRGLSGPVVVTVRLKSQARSVAQNAYYWGTVITTLSEHCGYTKPEMHDQLKGMFLPEGMSTAELTAVEMADYLDRITGWAWTTLQVAIPPSTTAS